MKAEAQVESEGKGKGEGGGESKGERERDAHLGDYPLTDGQLCASSGRFLKDLEGDQVTHTIGDSRKV